MELTIKKRENKLLNLECREMVDIDLINALMDSDLLRTEKATRNYSTRVLNAEKDWLYKYTKIIKYKKADVTYKRKINYGRVIPEHSLSLFCLRKELRHALCHENYIDIDVVNCHPVILEQLCKMNKINCENLSIYINDRENIIKRFIECFDIKDKEDNTARDIVKTFFITLMYGGTFEWFIEKNNIDEAKDEPLVLYVADLQDELKIIKKTILDLNPDLVKEVEDQKKEQKVKKYNLYNTSFSIYLQDFENRVLEQIYLYCCEKNYIKNNDCILSYDGIMLNKKKYKPKILNELQEHIYKTLNLKLKFITKDMNANYTMEYVKSHESKKKYFIKN